MRRRPSAVMAGWSGSGDVPGDDASGSDVEESGEWRGGARAKVATERRDERSS